ncbi:MAG: transcription initiation factor IIB [Candidatus Bathyarchaeota archaeon]|nr:transcription initiation factor IIB [Candidatus Termiticorpusculum sp.]
MSNRDSEKLSRNNLSTKTETEETQTCPQCDSTRTIHNFEYAETICMDCGFVLQQKTTNKEEKETEKKKATPKQRIKHIKTDTPLTYTIHDKGTTTVIDWHDRNVYDQNSHGSIGQKTQAYRLRKWQRRIRVSNSTEHNLSFALSEITKTINNLNLPKNILEQTSVTYQKTIKEHLTKGHSIQSVASATLYLTCRQNELPITLNEIAQASTTNKKEIGKSYRCLIKKLGYSTPPLHPNQHKTKNPNQPTNIKNTTN